MGGNAMPLRLVRRKGSEHWYVRGSVRGVRVFETTGTDRKEIAEAIRIKREARLLNESVFGKQKSLVFEEAALAYLENAGSPRFLGEFKNGKWTGLIGYFYGRDL